MATLLNSRSHLSGYDETLFYKFYLDDNFASAGPDGDWQANKDWMMKALLEQRDTPVTTMALRCLCISFFGRTHRRIAINNAAMVLYGRSLNALSKKLNDSQEVFGFDTLAATSILNYCEHVNFSSHFGWIQHSQGLAKIMILRGPTCFMQHPCKAIFAMSRPYLLIQAYLARRRTFLEQEEWLDIIAPTNADLAASEELTSIATRLPALTEDVTQLSLTRQAQDDFVTHRIEELEKIKDGLYRLQQNLQSWYARWQQAPHRLLTEPPLIQKEMYLTGDLQNPFFANIFVYETLDIAATTVLWNAYMITVLKRLNSLSELERSAGLESHQPNLLVSARPFAWNICQSIDYHLHGSRGYQGGHYVIFAAIQAFAGLSSQCPISQWLKRILRTIARDSGFAIAGAMLDAGQRTHSSAGIETGIVGLRSGPGARIGTRAATDAIDDLPPTH